MNSATLPAVERKSLVSDRGLRDMLVLGLVAASFDAEIVLTNNVVPITCRHFTDSAFIISAIIASKRLFGSLIQPWACWKSDFVRTSFGRRRVFLLFGLPGSALALLGVGLMPVLIRSEASRHTALALGALLIINGVLQITTDLNWGVLEPLYGDTFRQEKLGRASSLRQMASKLLTLFMMVFVIGWADFNEFLPYLFGAGVCFAAFVLITLGFREIPLEQPPAPASYSLFRHVGKYLRNRDIIKLAIVCTGNLALPAALSLLTPLYVTETLGLSMSALGRVQILGVVLAVALAAPLGWLIDYVGAKWVMAAGFGLYAISATGLAFWTHDYPTLFIYMTIFGIAQIVALMPMTAMVFQYSSPDERGHLFGVVQFCRAFSTFLLSLVLGSMVQLADSNDPTPLRARDLKTPASLVENLTPGHGPIADYVRSHLSPKSLDTVQHSSTEPAITPVQEAAFIADLNALLADPGLYSAERFAGVPLSRQSRRLVAEKPANDRQLFVTNRALLHDAFPNDVSRAVNYRVPYLASIVLALLVMGVALSARRGPYARTLSERRPPEASAVESEA